MDQLGFHLIRQIRSANQPEIVLHYFANPFGKFGHAGGWTWFIRQGRLKNVATQKHRRPSPAAAPADSSP